MKKIVIFFSLIFCIFSSTYAFNGRGTKENPYLISSYYDLEELSDAVSIGENFFDKYFKQVSDIDFPKNIKWHAIGDVLKGYAFCGIYDGNGKSISNIYCDEIFSGLFSLLNGTVKNLTIKSGIFVGHYVGSIASNGSGIIINCHNGANIIAKERAGGIVDNFSGGKIYLCSNYGTINVINRNNVPAGVCGYSVDIIEDCEVIQENVYNPYFFLGKILNSKSGLSIANLTLNKNFIFNEKNAPEKFYYYYFSGDGSFSNPYLIRTCKDFILFTELVNSGEKFQSKYFLQLANLNFENEVINSIGRVDSKNIFCGIYNGNGFAIQNFQIIDKGYASLFGDLGGTLLNINLCGKLIKGKISSSFCINSSSDDAKIINCINSTRLEGEKIAGIAYTFSGKIENCISVFNYAKCNEKSIYYPISSEYSKTFDNYCISNLLERSKYQNENFIIDKNDEETKVVKSDFSNFFWAHCFFEHKNSRKDNKEKEFPFEFLNDNLLLIAAKNNINTQIIKKWSGNTASLLHFSRESLQYTDFSGTGTVTDPFIIDNVQNLIDLSKLVNYGNTFNGMYFKQIHNIDFENKRFEPIGLYGQNNYFYGVYDGNGNSISNLYIQSDSNNGFFGMLGGTVVNFGIESGCIKGKCTGSITSHSIGQNAKIINCYNMASVIGYRVAGICDNFNGVVSGCYNTGKIIGVINQPIASFPSVTKLSNSYVDKLIKAKKLNRSLFLVEKDLDTDSILLNKWIDNDINGIKHSNIKYQSKIQQFVWHVFLILLFIIFILILVYSLKKWLFDLLKNELSENSFSFVLVFVCISIASFLQFFMFNAFIAYFHGDYHDTFMDLFNSIVYPFNDSYPPLAVLPYKIFNKMIYTGRNGFALKNTGTSSLILLIHLFSYTITLFSIVYYNIKGSKFVKMLFAFLFVFSGASLWVIERGNIIAFALVFSFLFLILYQDNSEKNKNLAYLFLIFAVSIKYYPAVFGIFLLEKRDWSGILKCIIGFIAIYFLSILLNGFLDYGSNFVYAFTNSYSNITNTISWATNITPKFDGLNFSLKNYLLGFDYFFNKFLGVDLKFLVEKLCLRNIKLLILGISVLSYFFIKDVWKKIFLMVILCVYIPDFSGGYIISFFLLPLLFFLNEDTSSCRIYSIFFAILVAVLVIPFKLCYGQHYTVTASFLVLQNVIAIFTILLWKEAITNIIIFLNRNIKYIHKI